MTEEQKKKSKDGGGTGIRTLGRLLTYAGVQNRCFQPPIYPYAGKNTILTDKASETLYTKFFSSDNFNRPKKTHGRFCQCELKTGSLFGKSTVSNYGS